jgi:hypothetical protein
MAESMRPCPYCGEQIKSNAVKCRFCGEFLEDEDEELEDEDEDEDEDDGGAMKWVAPVNRSGFAILAGYLGLLALVPVPFILYGFFASETNLKGTEKVLEVGAYINVALGAVSVLVGLIAIFMVFVSGKGGLGRAIFAIVAGIAGALAYWLLVNSWFIPERVNINKRRLPDVVKKNLEDAAKQGSAPSK